MKNKRLFGAPVMIFVLMILLVGVVMAAAPKQKEDVHAFPGPDGVAPSPGAKGTLVRHADSVDIDIRTNNLDPGGAYTVWVVNWDDSSLCNGDCDMEDVCAVAGASVYYVTGAVIADDGTANFSATIYEGPTTFAVNCAHGGVENGGLGDAENAELHFVMRTHGDPIPGLVPAQTQTFLGGCNTDVITNLNDCSDQQAVAFK